jgi:hypothetical protein
MKYTIAVEDSLGNESLLEFISPSVSEARIIARNKHILNYKLECSKLKFPTIWTFLEETSEESV